MESVGLIIIGWLFGVLTPAVSEFIQKPIHRRQIKKCLDIEFHRLRFQLTSSVSDIGVSRELFDRQILEKFQAMERQDRSPLYDESLHELLDKFLRLSDEGLLTALRSGRDPNAAFTFKKLSLPFLSSSLSRLQLFSHDYQRRALEVAADLSLINDSIDYAALNIDRTFDQNFSEHNRKMIMGNVDCAYKTIFSVTLKIADNIEALFAMKK